MAVKKLWTVKQFIELLFSITKIPTVYMSSGTLSDVTKKNRDIFASWCPGAWKSGKVDKCIAPVLDKGTHLGADCSNLFKGLVWGWNPQGKKIQPNGAGVVRKSNGLGDVTADGLFNLCEDISTDMKRILPGEMIWAKGHIGMYYGKVDGKDYVIDSTPSLNGVKLNPMSRQNWKKHGKFPWVDYTDATPAAGEENVIRRVLKRTTPTMKGDDVKLLQNTLIDLNYSCGSCGADGKFGGDTEKAVKKYQAAHALEVDGKAGRHTVTSLGLLWKG